MVMLLQRFIAIRPKILSKMELAWHSDCEMGCHATTWGSIPGGDGVKTELHVLLKGQ